MSEHKLHPKPTGRRRTKFIPSLAPAGLQTFIGNLAPDERKALDFIAEHGDLIDVDGVPTHLLVPAPAKLINILAAVGAEMEDRENDLEDEPDVDREQVVD